MAEGDFGTAHDGTLDAPGGDEPQDTSEPFAGATTGEQAPAGPEEESHPFNPADIDSLAVDDSVKQRIRSTLRQIIGPYTKATQERKAALEKAAIVDRFNTDPAYRKQIIEEYARQMGYSLGRQGEAQAPTTPSTNGTHGEPPPQFVEAMKAHMSPELHWLADAQAPAIWAGLRQTLEPLQQQAERQRQQTFESEMDAKYAIWREHEADISEAFRYIQAGEFRHPKLGNLLEIFFRGLAADSIGTATATRRMAEAGRNRTTTGRASAATESNIKDRVRDPKLSRNEAFDLAVADALAKHGLGRG